MKVFISTSAVKPRPRGIKINRGFLTGYKHAMQNPGKPLNDTMIPKKLHEMVNAGLKAGKRDVGLGMEYEPNNAYTAWKSYEQQKRMKGIKQFDPKEEILQVAKVLRAKVVKFARFGPRGMEGLCSKPLPIQVARKIKGPLAELGWEFASSEKENSTIYSIVFNHKTLDDVQLELYNTEDNSGVISIRGVRRGGR